LSPTSKTNYSLIILKRRKKKKTHKDEGRNQQNASVAWNLCMGEQGKVIGGHY
jgi:hypothetical protein